MITSDELTKHAQQLIDVLNANSVPLDGKLIAIAPDVCDEMMAAALSYRVGIPTEINRFIPSMQIMLMDREEFKRATEEADLLNPIWNEYRRGPHWTRYIGERVRGMWDTFTDEQRKAIADDSYDFDSADARWDE